MKKGKSLSACIRQIAEGIVDEAEVIVIEAGTKCRTLEDFENVLNTYQHLDWKNYPGASDIALRFWHAGKIKQPRMGLFGKSPDLSKGVWEEI